MSSLYKIKYVFKHSNARHVRIFSSYQKWYLLEMFYPFKICQHTKFNGPTLTGASLASTSDV
jgi:hypothetical protein